MPRSSRTGDLQFDPEIEKTARRLRRETKQQGEETSTSYEDGRDITLDLTESSGESEEEVMAIIPERSIKDMTSPDLNQQPLCNEYPGLEVDFELKSGLSAMDRKLIDAASGGALFNKTPIEACNLISIMASNTQQFKTRYDDPPKRSNEVSVADQLSELTSLVKQIVVEKHHVKVCGICTSPEHVTDMCPTLLEPPTEHAEAIGGFSGQQRRYDPFSRTYNPGWRDHPNLSYGAQNQNFQRPQNKPPMPPPPANTKQEHSAANPAAPAKRSAAPAKHSAVPAKCSDKHSAIGVSNESTGVICCRLESQGKLPSQPIVNPKQNASAIVLRCGKELQDHKEENDTKRGHAQKRKPEKEVKIPQDDEPKEDQPKVLVTRPPFPKRFTKSKRRKKRRRSLRRFARNRVVIQLADRSVVYPEGVLEDVLVQVNELVFPADFYVLDMREDNFPNSMSILLGRPFLKTARTKIDVHSGTLTMEFDGEIIRFNIYDSMRYPTDIPTALLVDVLDPLVQSFATTNNKDHVKFAIEESLTPEQVKALEESGRGYRHH
ncbi:UNVERIFIED_CONTAM: hypothetical protein Slati_1329000 [Sesamum latifolium]|uniref:Reverse transcriptase domain-containing protein n=1 Tax=Sesamum latifolium TaxID=2727402 RepID=A0AAW2XK53_9LAMI